MVVGSSGRPRLGRPGRDVPRRPLACGPLPARTVQQPARRTPALGPPESRQRRRHGALRVARRHPAPAVRRPGAARCPDPRHVAGSAAVAALLAAARATRIADPASLRDSGAGAAARCLQLVELPRPRRAEDRLLDRRDRRRDRARRHRGRGLRGAGEAVRAGIRDRHGADVAHVPGLRRARRLRGERAPAQAAALRTSSRDRTDAPARVATAPDPRSADPGLDQEARLPRQLCRDVDPRDRPPDPPADLRPDPVPDCAGAAASSGGGLDRDDRRQPRAVRDPRLDVGDPGRRGLDPRDGRACARLHPAALCGAGGRRLDVRTSYTPFCAPCCRPSLLPRSSSSGSPAPGIPTPCSSSPPSACSGCSSPPGSCGGTAWRPRSVPGSASSSDADVPSSRTCSSP